MPFFNLIKALKREKIGGRGSKLLINFYFKGYNQPKLLYINKYQPNFISKITYVYIVDIFIMQRAITLHKLMKMQITHKKHYWPFLGLVFEINHICSKSFVFTTRKNTIVLIVVIKSLCLQKKMLIS